MVSTFEVSTTGEPTAIRISADADKIAADRRDVAHLTVEILDAQGRIVPVADNEITFEMEGQGSLIGVDNGDTQSHEDCKSNRRKAFNGLCLAIVQSTNNPGQIRVKVTSPSLQAASVIVSTKG